MVYTVTLNPAIDYVAQVDDLTLGAVNRLVGENFYPGGKGINVSQILTELSVPTVALGFVGGFTGKFIEENLTARGISTNFTRIEGISRINVKVKNKVETELNGKGPNIGDASVATLVTQIESIQSGEVLVLSGSLASGMPTTFYADVMQQLRGSGVKIAVDTTGDTLMNTLAYEPFLIKPNQYELEEIFGVKIESIDDVIKYGKELQVKGAKNVLISLGGDGALLMAEDGQLLRSNVPAGVVKNSVGAGDSMVAGFIAGYLRYSCYQEALRLGAASGSATAFSSDLAKRELIEQLLVEIRVSQYL